MGRVDQLRFVLISGFVLALCILALPSWSGASEIIYYSNISVNNYPNEYGTGYLSLTTDLWQAMPFNSSLRPRIRFTALDRCHARPGVRRLRTPENSSRDGSASGNGLNRTLIQGIR